jgi:hypothetical protein
MNFARTRTFPFSSLLRDSYTEAIMSEQRPTNVLPACQSDGALMASRTLSQVARAELKPAMREVTSTT